MAIAMLAPPAAGGLAARLVRQLADLDAQARGALFGDAAEPVGAVRAYDPVNRRECIYFGAVDRGPVFRLTVEDLSGPEAERVRAVLRRAFDELLVDQLDGPRAL